MKNIRNVCILKLMEIKKKLMEIKYQITFIILLFSFNVNSQDSSINVILEEQVNSTKTIYREIRELDKSITKITKEVDSLNQTFSKSLNIQDSIRAELSKANQFAVRPMSKNNKQNSCTDWIKAIAQVLGLPLVLIAIYKFVAVDKNRQQEIASLKKMANSQANINNELIDQVKELQKQTIELKNQSSEMVKQSAISNSALENQNQINEKFSTIASELGLQTKEFSIQSSEMVKQSTISNSALENQNQINEKFSTIASELSLQTKEFSVQSNLMNDKNNLAIESLELEKEKYSYEKTKRLEELEEYYSEMIKSLEKPLTNQADLLNKFAENLKVKEISNYALHVDTSLVVDNLDKIDYNDLFKIYVTNRKGDKNKKVKLFKELEMNIFFIKEYRNKIPKDYEEFQLRYIRYQDEWRDNISTIKNLYELYLKENIADNVHPDNDAFFSKFYNLFNEWIEMENDDNVKNVRDPYFVNEHLLQPLKEICNEHPEKRSNILIPYISSCEHALREHDHLKKMYSNSAEKNAKELLETKKYLIESLNELEKLDRM